jgi:glycosyltransferase involved in cell wall biosynthesis
MNIVFVSTTDTYGGAGIAAYRTFKSLQKQNVNVKMFVQYKFSTDAEVVESKHKFYGYFRTGVDKVVSWLMGDVWSSSIIPSGNVQQILELKPDIVHLHWINNTLSLSDIKQLQNRGIQIVWTLHDMWLTQGGYHYVPEKSLSVFQRKLDHLFQSNKCKNLPKLNQITLIAPSKWLATVAKKSANTKKFPLENIPYAIPLDMFCPIKNAKSKLNLNPQKKYVLFGAMASLQDKRKGSDLLIRAVNVCNDDDFEILIFGSEKAKLPIKQKIHFLGTIKDSQRLATIYSAADVFVAPSRQDNLPNTVIESLSCGTPVIAFNIGGMPDMIDNTCGRLVKSFHTKELSDAIIDILNHKEHTKLRKNARTKALRIFNEAKIANNHIRLYKRILKQKTN